jgi:hypothetical protein
VTFEEVLTQAIAMLQRLGRVSYRALIRQFALDEDYFADLKDALLYACPEVIDDGRGFIWSGATETSPILPQRVQDARLMQDAFPSPLSPPPDAERRQLSWRSWGARTAVHTTRWIRLAQNGHQDTWRGIIRHRS